MADVASDLWFLPDSNEFAESTPYGLVTALPPAEIIYKADYLNQPDGTLLDQAQARLGTHDYWERDDIFLLRPTSGSDGPPFRSVLLYISTNWLDVKRLDDPRVPQSHNVGVIKIKARLFQALRIGSRYVWESDLREGKPGFFLTGTAGTSALWRVARIEADALNRQVLTLAPVRLPHALPMPVFASVADATLRQYLEEQFSEFRGAVATGAYLAVIDRAANLAEAVLAHCLVQIGHDVPDRLADRLQVARRVLEDRGLRPKFALSDLGYFLANKIRLLHAQIHEDQARKRGSTVRPEVGLGVAIDVSELLVGVGLAQY